MRQQATPGLRLVDNGTKGLSTGDPAGGCCTSAPDASISLCVKVDDQTTSPPGCACVGFTAVDVLGHGTMGHVIGVGAILSLRVRGVTTCLSCLCQLEGCILFNRQKATQDILCIGYTVSQQNYVPLCRRWARSEVSPCQLQQFLHMYSS